MKEVISYKDKGPAVMNLEKGFKDAGVQDHEPRVGLFSSDPIPTRPSHSLNVLLSFKFSTIQVPVQLTLNVYFYNTFSFR